MANLNGINIERGSIGVNISSSKDNISGIIINVPPSINLTILDTPKIVYNIKDVINFGIDDKLDKTHKINVFRHLKEFFRIAGEGTELHILITSKPLSEILQDSVIGVSDSLAKKLIIFSNGKIRQLAFSLNPSTTPTQLNGINSDILESIPKVQGLAEWSYDNHMPLHIILEGRDYTGSANSVQNLREITNVKADKVSIVIGQDYKYGSSLIDDIQKKYADIGTCLGTISKAKVFQNIGNNEEFNITDSTKDAWMEAGLSNNKSLKEQFYELQTLEDKGYIFGVEYTGLNGVRWNNDHTCTPKIEDSEGNINENSISYSRTLNKTVRGLREAYLPKIKTNQMVDIKTGKLLPTVISYFNNIGQIVIDLMVSNGELSGGKVTVDPNSNIISSDKTLKIAFEIVPVGCIEYIKGTINIKTKIT